MKMRLKDGKYKAFTLSYDDGVVQDIRLMEIMNRYGIKGTFNINTGIYLPDHLTRQGPGGRLNRQEAIALYKDSGHEVAVHGLTHPFLERLHTDEMIYEIVEDRRNLEEQYGVIARGMAYPFGTYDSRVLNVLKQCGIGYARTIKDTLEFDFPENWLELHPTCHHNHPKLKELGQQLVDADDWHNNAKLFYLWGHSYEFDDDNNWDMIEDFLKFMGGRDDIWYATNIEIYDYVQAFWRLETSYDKKRIHNPSAIDVWVDINREVYCIKAGETLILD